MAFKPKSLDYLPRLFYYTFFQMLLLNKLRTTDFVTVSIDVKGITLGNAVENNRASARNSEREIAVLVR